MYILHVRNYKWIRQSVESGGSLSTLSPGTCQPSWLRWGCGLSGPCSPAGSCSAPRSWWRGSLRGWRLRRGLQLVQWGVWLRRGLHLVQRWVWLRRGLHLVQRGVWLRRGLYLVQRGVWLRRGLQSRTARGVAAARTARVAAATRAAARAAAGVAPAGTVLAPPTAGRPPTSLEDAGPRGSRRGTPGSLGRASWAEQTEKG